MALNPILFTERVVADFLRYQLTTYAFADPRLRHFGRLARYIMGSDRAREVRDRNHWFGSGG